MSAPCARTKSTLPGPQTAVTVAPRCLPQLHGEVAHAAARAGDEQLAAGSQLRMVLERLDGGAARDRQRGRSREVDAVGYRDQVLVRSDDDLGQRTLPAERRQRAEDALADEVRRRPAADADDDAGELDADAARRALEARHQREVAGADLPVQRVEAHGVDPDLERPGRALGLGHVRDVQVVGRAVAVVAQRLHRGHRPPSSAWSRSVASGTTASASSCVADRITGGARPAS